MIYLLSFLYFILWGFISINGRVSNKSIVDKPLLYNSVFIQGILTIFSTAWIFATLAFLIYSWKLALILFPLGLLIGHFIFDPLVERFILWPIASYLIKKGKEMEDKEKDI